MTELKKLLINLRDLGPAIEGSYPVCDIPLINRHKVGLTRQGCSIFFVHCNIPSIANGLNYDLEMIRVRFGLHCKLDLGNGIIQNDQYTLLELKEGFLELEDYFLEIIYLMLRNIPEKLSAMILRKEIDRVVNLFNKISEPAFKSIQGLWAELFVVERSKDPIYLIHAWHVNKENCFDFNDGIDKLEVKSTLKNLRVHSFSSQQLNPNRTANLLIASVMVLQTGIGTSIFDLTSSIETRLDDLEDVIKLREIVAATLGNDLNRSFNFFFDYPYAVDNLTFYDYTDIPTINFDTIPQEISNIHFDVNLSQIKQLDLNNFPGKLVLSL